MRKFHERLGAVRVTVAALALLALRAGGAAAQGQCTVGPTMVQFAPAGNPQGYGPSGKFRGGYATSLDLYNAGSKMILRENYGYTTYNLTNPTTPVPDKYCDMEQVYKKAGDGFSTVFNVAAAPDGSRVLIGYLEHNYNGTSGQGVLLMGPGVGSLPGCTFNFAGEMPPTRATGNAVAKVGSRYIGFTTGGTGLYVGDVTTFLTGTNIINPVPNEVVFGAPSGIGDSGVIRGSYFIYHGNSQVAVIDFSGVGSSGPIASSLGVASMSAADFGFPAGDKIASVAADVHPNGKLYVMVEAMNALTAAPDGYALATVRSGVVTPVGGIFKDPAYDVGGTATAIATADDVLFFAWREPAGTTPATHKLYTFSANGWGSDLSTAAVFATGDYPAFQKASAMRLLTTSSGHFQMYLGAKAGAYALPISCAVSTNNPATTELTAQVSNGSGGFTALAPGATVYLGDTVKLSPTVSPAAAQQPVTDWRMDLDFHSASSAENAGGTFPRLANADLKAATDGVFPSTVTLVGPCDPSANGNYLSGSGCWTSVQTNNASGGPDFPASVTAGATKTLTFAVEAQNALGSANLKTFDLVWKVPAVRLATTSVLGGGGPSVLTDGSEGHPVGSLSSPYKWYFGADPSAPRGEALTQDTSCTGPICNHTFASKGTFSYWLTVPYANGYASPDCGVSAACTAAGGQTITVSDVVLNFTAPATVIISSPTATVTSTSQKASGITSCGAGLEYNVATAGSPAGTTWTPLTLTGGLTGTGAVALPATAATYWLRIRYNYSGGTGCLQASWTPAVAGVSDPTAWPITVSTVQPTMSLFVNDALCGLGPGGGSNCQAHPGDTIKAKVYLDGVLDANPPADLSWSVTPGGPSNSAVNPFQFTAGSASASSYTVHMSGYGGYSLQQDFSVSAATALSVTASANPSSITVGGTVNFTASPSGGSGPYTYSWSFGDGANSTQQSPSHSYTSAASPFRVTVSARDNVGATAQSAINVWVTTSGGGGGSGGSGGGGTVDFAVGQTGGANIQLNPDGSYDLTAGMSYSFYSRGATAGYTITFGDGGSLSGTAGDNGVAHTYGNVSSLTNYTASISADGGAKAHVIHVSPSGGGGGGSGGGGTVSVNYSLIDTATGLAVPLDLFTASYPVSSGQAVTFVPSFSPNTPVAVSWTFGDGTTSTESQPTHTYNSLTDVQYSAKITGPSNSVTYKIKVKGSAGAALTGTYGYRYEDNSAVNTAAVPANTAIRFTAVDAADTYTWDFGDGTALGSGSPVSHAYSSGGTYRVVLTVSKAGQVTTATPSPVSFTVLPPPEPDTWLVPGMVYSDGLGGAQWQSDLTIFNPSSTLSMTLSLAFMDSLAPVASANQIAWNQVILGKGATATFANVLSTFFRAQKGHYGAILVRGDVVPMAPVFTARTYNTGSSGGTFGLSVPASASSGGVRPQASGASSRLIGLKENDAAYTNLGISNLKADAASVEVRFFDAANNQIGQPVSFSLGPYGVTQFAHVLSSDPPNGAGYKDAVGTFSAVVKVITGTSVAPFATVIDQVSKDPIVVTPQARPASTYRMPGIVRVQGANDTVWRSDIVVHNASSRTRTVNISFSYLSSGGYRTSTSGFVTFAPGQSLEGVDFVKVWLGLADNDVSSYSNSWLDIAPAVETDGTTNTDPLLVLGKTYNNQPTGNVGLQVPGFTTEDAVSATSPRKRLLMTGLTSSSSYRANVAFFLMPSSASQPQATATLEVYDGSGNLAKQVPIVLDNVTSFLQKNDNEIFADLPAVVRSRMSLVIDNVQGNAAIGSYATIVDNVSGDGTFVQAVPVP